MNEKSNPSYAGENGIVGNGENVNKSLSHTKWKCQYHIVFIPKYRKKNLYGNMKMM